MKLVIGERNWSSWSLRPWLVLKAGNFEFEEISIHLRCETTRAEILAYSPSRWVPALVDGNITIWDSLAICEYLAEVRPGLWPADRTSRAVARSVVSEMHSGFTSLRETCPMDLALRTRTSLGKDAREDVERIANMWRTLRLRHAPEGVFLFGEWSIADAFFTPVASRLRTHGISLDDFGDDGIAQIYADALLSQPNFMQWEMKALQEPLQAWRDLDA